MPRKRGRKSLKRPRKRRKTLRVHRVLTRKVRRRKNKKKKKRRLGPYQLSAMRRALQNG